MNKFPFVNSEHGNVLKVAGTLPDDTPNLDLDAVKDTKKSFLLDKERMMGEVLLFLKIHPIFICKQMS